SRVPKPKKWIDVGSILCSRVSDLVTRLLRIRKGDLLPFLVHSDLGARRKLALQNGHGERVFDLPLKDPLHRACAKVAVVAPLRQFVDGRRVKPELELALAEP